MGHAGTRIQELTEELEGLRRQVSDLQAEIAAQRSVGEEVRKLMRAIEHSPTLVIITDTEANIEYVNPKFTQVTGYLPEEVKGENARLLKSGETPKEEYQRMWEMLTSGEEWRGEFHNRRKNGDYYWVSASISPIFDEQGRITHFVAVEEDITEQKRVERELEQSKLELERSNSELGQFASIASHDLQEPLRMIAGFVRLLQKRYHGKLDAEADEYIGFIVDGVERMQKLIHDLLTFSRVGTQAGNIEWIDSRAALDRAIANLRVALDDSGASITHDPLPEILADGTQLGQLFQNLIGNAIKFRGEARPKVHIGLKNGDQEWLFSVSDNGIGIDQQYFERIFMVFQRLHTRQDYPGTGLGLAICRKIVERHRGRIWVESEVGKGSTFYFTMPKSE